MTDTLLVEMLCEELPPKALARLGESFAASLAAGLRKREMLEASAGVRAFATPRRLGVEVTGVKPASEPRSVEMKLMPVAVGLDAQGKATPALAKKLEAAGLGGIDVASLKRRPDGKAEMLFADARTAAVPLAQALQGALDEALAALPIPKVMSYQLADGETTVHFVRPAHALVALHGAEVVPVSALGLRAGRATRGHRFQGKAELTLASAGDYERALEAEGGVIAAFAQRRAAILQQLEGRAREAGASLGEPASYEALLDEVTALVEMPTVYTGTFEKEFLAVPPECLVLTMRQNQKYFPLFDAAGALTHRFLIVSNMRLADPANIVSGNERVVRPRLADARFFFETDRKVKLSERVGQLATIVYHNKLGTQRDRVDRLVSLATRIQEGLPRGAGGVEWAVRAAYLAKADLVTLMVGEFPELQGVMGRYYAESDGEPPSVARAIEQHYWPRFAGDALPTGDASIAVALADRIDSLVGMFSIGQVPTGDKDPFALRRAALGVVRILMETRPALAMPLRPLLRAAAKTLKVAPEKLDELVAAVEGFIRERLANLMRERGYSAHEVAAVLEVESAEAHADRLDLVPAKLEAVRVFRKLPEAESLAAANKRIQNILRKSPSERAADYALLQLPEEKRLHASLSSVSAVVNVKLAENDFAGTLTALAGLRADVDSFFDKVLVNAEDANLRAARLGLLAELGTTMNRVADISKLCA